MEKYTLFYLNSQEDYYDNYGWPMHTTYYLVKDIGLIAIHTKVGLFEIDII